MIPVIAIVGRPNVGKSTLFNRLTRTRDALVIDLPGVTRDRLYGEATVTGGQYLVIDTGGFEVEQEGMTNLMAKQARQAIDEADVVLFMVDARQGLNATDRELADQLRQVSKPIVVLANKVDGVDENIITPECYELGFANVFPIASTTGRGISSLLTKLTELVAPYQSEQTDQQYPGTRVAIVGKPNVGKSTLINRIMGEERVVVFDQPGTTRDSIFIPFERLGSQYTLIDTAGVRKRGKIHDIVEKFSVIKTLKAIEAANVVVFVVDAQDGVSDQDLRLLGFVIRSGKALVVAVNKWDGLSGEHRDDIKNELSRRIEFTSFAKLFYISALHGTGVGNLFAAIDEAYLSATKDLSTSLLTELLQDAVSRHEPPLVRGRRIKLRYAHCGGHNPQIIVIHGNQTDDIPKAYQRYLNNYFRGALKLVGTPVRIQFKSGENPFAGRKNKLTQRQERRRRRVRRQA